MNKLIKPFYLCALLIGSLALSSSAQAFDGQRKGFFLSLGIGAHASELGNLDEAGLATSFRIGMGLTDNIVLYYLNNVGWYNNGDYLWASGVSGIGGTFYFRPSSPSFYLTSAIGIGSLSANEKKDNLGSDPDDADGTAIMIGAGFEIGKTLHLEANLSRATLEFDSSFVSDIDVTTLMFLANFAFY